MKFRFIGLFFIAAFLVSCGDKSAKEVTTETESTEEVREVSTAAKTDEDVITFTGLDGSIDYQESPLLAKMAEEGKIPPVEDRLPIKEDVCVVEPIQSIGHYGGTARTFNAEGPTRPYTSMMLMGAVWPFKTTLSGKPGCPDAFKSYEANEDYTVWTIHLRKGLRWSDGVELKAQEIYEFYRYDRGNTDINSGLVPEYFSYGDDWVSFNFPDGKDRILTIKVIDDYTLEYSSDKPHPFLINDLSHYHSWTLRMASLEPFHFLKRFHPEFIGMEQAQAKEYGYDTWFKLYEFFTTRQGQQSNTQVLGNFPPTLQAYIAVEKTQDTIIYERNPYFFKVDTEGRQLPYIDRIICEQVPDREILNGKIISGESDYETFMTETKSIPLYKQYEEEGGYTTYLWNFIANATTLEFNYSYKEDHVRELFRTKEFRHAMSYAIDRERINKEVCFGMGSPTRMTVMESTMWYKPEYSTKHLAYDPEKAKTLLDELGVVDKDGDGFREAPNGETLSINIEYYRSESPRQPIVEIVVQNLADVGLRFNNKLTDPRLGGERNAAGEIPIWVWHGDARTETLFPAYINSHMFPLNDGGAEGWSDWNNTGGLRGEEPPEEVKEVFDAYKLMSVASSREDVIKYGQVMLDAAAENMWIIGTVNDFPHPMTVKNDMVNFPGQDDGYPLIYEWTTWWTNPYEPSHFYFTDRPELSYEDSKLPEIYPKNDGTDYKKLSAETLAAVKEHGWF